MLAFQGVQLFCSTIPQPVSNFFSDFLVALGPHPFEASAQKLHVQEHATKKRARLNPVEELIQVTKKKHGMTDLRTTRVGE